MITTGAKFYFGLGFLLLVAAVLYGWTSGGVDWGLFPGHLGDLYFEMLGALTLGYKGAVGDHLGYGVLLGGAAASTTIGSFMVAFRDADDKPLAEVAGLPTAPPLQPVSSSNVWATIGAFAVAVIAVGVATSGWFIIAGAVLLTIAALEWSMYAWADRATGDAAVNASLRNKIMNPIEVPLFGAIVALFIAVSISRLFLTVPKLSATWLFLGIAALIFVTAIALAAAPKVPKAAVRGLLAIAAIAVLAIGIAGAVSGPREFHNEDEEFTVEGTGGPEDLYVYGQVPTTTAAVQEQSGHSEKKGE